MSGPETPLRPCLEVLEGHSSGHVFELVRRQVMVGRSPGADLLIEDAGVSRRHVRISLLDDGSVVAVDMRSTNGLIVNGEKVERATLEEGDVLRLGPDAVLRFTKHGVPRARPTVIASGGAELSIDKTADTLSGLTRTKPQDLPLSARQIEVGRLVAAGLTNAAIAGRMGISHRTVTSHLDHIYGRLGIGSRAALARWIAERGLLEPK